jgi:hypothetical protein
MLPPLAPEPDESLHRLCELEDSPTIQRDPLLHSAVEDTMRYLSQLERWADSLKARCTALSFLEE